MEIKDLTRAELDVMQILWQKNRAFVSEILEEMPEPKPAYNTVSTVIRVLEKKGVVGHHVHGKSYRYYPLINKEQYTRSFMRKVVYHFFDDSPSRLISFFCENESISNREKEIIMRIAQDSISRRRH